MELVISSFVVVETDGLLFDTVGRTNPFCTGGKRRLSGKREVRKEEFVLLLLSCRRSLIERRRCVTVTNGSAAISLFELFNVVDENEEESISSCIEEVLCQFGNESSPF